MRCHPEGSAMRLDYQPTYVFCFSMAGEHKNVCIQLGHVVFISGASSEDAHSLFCDAEPLTVFLRVFRYGDAP